MKETVVFMHQYLTNSNLYHEDVCGPCVAIDAGDYSIVSVTPILKENRFWHLVVASR